MRTGSVAIVERGVNATPGVSFFLNNVGLRRTCTFFPQTSCSPTKTVDTRTILEKTRHPMINVLPYILDWKKESPRSEKCGCVTRSVDGNLNVP